MTEPAPRIAIPARLSIAGPEEDPRVAAANRIFHDVVDLVRRNGLDPVVISSAADVDLTGFDGVVLPGGGDLDPARYGGAASDAVYDVNPEQDSLDLEVAGQALRHGLPVLGICRGAQVLNVAAGGTLYADLAPTGVEHYHRPVGDEELRFLRHEVRLEPSALRDLLGAETVSVATGHHQGIDLLGDGLRAIATAEDGLVEAFEDRDGRVIGVQWHPEAEPAAGILRDGPFRLLADAIRGVTAHV